jgi:hypothetical protein
MSIAPARMATSAVLRSPSLIACSLTAPSKQAGPGLVHPRRLRF